MSPRMAGRESLVRETEAANPSPDNVRAVASVSGQSRKQWPRALGGWEGLRVGGSKGCRGRSILGAEVAHGMPLQRERGLLRADANGYGYLKQVVTVHPEIESRDILARSLAAPAAMECLVCQSRNCRFGPTRANRERHPRDYRQFCIPNDPRWASGFHATLASGGGNPMEVRILQLANRRAQIGPALLDHR